MTEVQMTRLKYKTPLSLLKSRKSMLMCCCSETLPLESVLEVSLYKDCNSEITSRVSRKGEMFVHWVLGIFISDVCFVPIYSLT